MKNLEKRPQKNQVPIEILHVNSKKVSCDGLKEGQKDPAGHPLVYLNMGSEDFVTCPYCSKYFTVARTAKTNTIRKK